MAASAAAQRRRSCTHMSGGANAAASASRRGLLLGKAADGDVGLHLEEAAGSGQGDGVLVALAGVRLGADGLVAAAADQHQAAPRRDALHLPVLAQCVSDDLPDRGNGVGSFRVRNDANLESPVDHHIRILSSGPQGTGVATVAGAAVGRGNTFRGACDAGFSCEWPRLSDRELRSVRCERYARTANTERVGAAHVAAAAAVAVAERVDALPGDCGGRCRGLRPAGEDPLHRA